MSSPPPETLEREVETIRDNLDGIVTELDLRRRELTDWRGLLRKHRGTLLVIGGSFAAFVTGIVLFSRWRGHRQERLASQTQGWRHSLARMIDDRGDVAKKPTPGVGRKIAAATGSAIAVAVSKQLVQHLFKTPRTEETALVTVPAR